MSRLDKRCITCRKEYPVQEHRCPACGGYTYEQGFEETVVATSFLSTSNSTLIEDILDASATVLSGIGNVAGDVMSSISDIDFSGGGVSDLFD